MALEESIVAWSKGRPAWQREVMIRTASGDVLTESDYDALVADLLQARVAGKDVELGLNHFAKIGIEEDSVSLVSIAKPEHVNALASEQPLSFELKGLTIVYGDNGSGKSGYARLLKRIARTRHQEEVLSDVFRDTVIEKPTANLSVEVGGNVLSFSWPNSAGPELRRMLFYDSACGNDYIAAESDFPYRPSALAVMDGLINACVAVRTRLDVKLVENARNVGALPLVPDELKETYAGGFLMKLSGSTKMADLDALITRFDESTESIDALQQEEARLRNADTSNERKNLSREAEKLGALRSHIETIHSEIGDDALDALQQKREKLRVLGEAANLLVRAFESEPIKGVGSFPWKELWESARRYSNDIAYPDRRFPVVGVDSRCVLCQQVLDADSESRLTRFEKFIREDTQSRFDEARKQHEERLEALSHLSVSPDAVLSHMKDLDPTHASLIAETKTLLSKYEQAQTQTCDAIKRESANVAFGIQPDAVLTSLAAAAATARQNAAESSDPAVIRKRLESVTLRRKELEFLQTLKNSRETILQEIKRMQEREALETAKSAAATGPLTKTILEFSEESITEVVRDTFTRETERLRLERVTIARTRADRGNLFHQPKLVGARQIVRLPRVLSEGERTALGLAAFFTEAQLDASRSALILDDPVTSLDHIRRGLVATRLVEFAEHRQVIVFTHDVAFVADLKREASGKGVLVAERSVTRSRAGERKPGACVTEHPWKAKDVSARLQELRQGLAELRTDSGSGSDQEYESRVAVWAGNLSETWERVFSQEIVGRILAEGGLEVRPKMVKVLASFSEGDYREFEASYSRASQWAKRHDKSAIVNYVAPEVAELQKELDLLAAWFKRVKGYQS